MSGSGQELPGQAAAAGQPAWRAALLRLWRGPAGTALVVVGVFFAVHLWQTRGVQGDALPMNATVTLLGPDGREFQTTLGQAVAAVRTVHAEGVTSTPVALYFWAEWCSICKLQQPSIGALQEDWPVLTIAMQSGPPSEVASTQTQRALPWTTVVDETGSLTSAVGFHAVPAFAVIDSAGRLRAPTAGYTTGWGMRLRLWWAHVTGAHA
ncbi:MAG: redoxin domain-containing protein [Serpentinimonas sp.]|nr:redoxin domain-containing protein [Serpentinimonas sp.]